MTGTFSSRTYEIFLGDFQKALRWLTTLGIQYLPTRFGKYEKTIKAFINKKPFHLEEVETALYEANDLIEIFKGLSLRFDGNLIEHIKTYISGPVSYIEESATNSSNAARNISFELLLMAKLTRAAIPLDFQIKTTDVAAFFDNRSLLFECKRPQSKNSLEGNIKKAFRQLEKKYEFPERPRHRGIIALDITKIINPEFARYDRDNEKVLDLEVSNEIDRFVADNKLFWQKGRDSKTIAVLLYVSLLSLNEGRGQMLTYYQQSGITPINHVGERNIQTVREFARIMRMAVDNPAT